jgi:hypothetical protein
MAARGRRKDPADRAAGAACPTGHGIVPNGAILGGSTFHVFKERSQGATMIDVQYALADLPALEASMKGKTSGIRGGRARGSSGQLQSWPQSLMALQRSAGNGAVALLVQRHPLTGSPSLQRSACGGSCGGSCCGGAAKSKDEETSTDVPAVQRSNIGGREQCGLEASRESSPDADEPTVVDDVVATNALPCYGGGAVSVCNPGTGNYDITANNNTCASRDCSQRHEERHVSDLGPCCKKLHDAITAGGDRDTLVGKYNTWMNAGAHAWTECNAYGVSLSCVSRLLTANKCDKQSSQTCDELKDYQTDMTAQQTSWCAGAPAALPACPFP